MGSRLQSEVSWDGDNEHQRYQGICWHMLGCGMWRPRMECQGSAYGAKKECVIRNCCMAQGRTGRHSLGLGIKSSLETMGRTFHWKDEGLTWISVGWRVKGEEVGSKHRFLLKFWRERNQIRRWSSRKAGKGYKVTAQIKGNLMTDQM